jgi:hypothetical protein
MYDRKEEISARHVYLKHGDLYAAASKAFGSYENAVNQAGIDYDSIRKKHKDYTKEELLDYLRSLQAEGYSLHSASVKEISSSMTNIIMRTFGSYKAAIEALEALGLEVEFQKHIRFGKNRLRPDFVDLRTGTWIDAKLSSYSGGVSETVRKYQKCKKKVMIIYLDGNERIWPDGSVDITPISDFYEALREVGADGLIRDFEKLKKGIVRPELQEELDIHIGIEKRP